MLRQHVMVLILNEGSVGESLQQSMHVIKRAYRVGNWRQIQALDLSKEVGCFAHTLLEAGALGTASAL